MDDVEFNPVKNILFTMLMPSSFKERVDEYAKSNDTSVAQLVRRLLKKELEETRSRAEKAEQALRLDWVPQDSATP